MDAFGMVNHWRKQGTMISILGRELFVVDTGSRDLPVLVLLHGYPSSSFDFLHVLPILSADYRVIVHDHLGFGLSEKPLDYSYSLMEQADMAMALWKELGIKEANLVAHDYGTSVATEILARKMDRGLPIRLLSVTLSNGSIHIELAKLRLIQKLLRHRFWGPVVAKLGNEHVYTHQMRRLWYDRSLCNNEEIKALWLMNSSGNGRKVLPMITQYLNERYQYWDRWIGALKVLDIPAHILWAQEDPVAVKEIGEQLHLETPNSSITRLGSCGHYPMLEAPQRWASEVKNFVRSLINEK